MQIRITVYGCVSGTYRFAPFWQSNLNITEKGENGPEQDDEVEWKIDEEVLQSTERTNEMNRKEWAKKELHEYFTLHVAAKCHSHRSTSFREFARTQPTKATKKKYERKTKAFVGAYHQPKRHVPTLGECTRRHCRLWTTFHWYYFDRNSIHIWHNGVCINIVIIDSVSDRIFVISGSQWMHCVVTNECGSAHKNNHKTSFVTMPQHILIQCPWICMHILAFREAAQCTTHKLQYPEYGICIAYSNAHDTATRVHIVCVCVCVWLQCDKIAAVKPTNNNSNNNNNNNIE